MLLLLSAEGGAEGRGSGRLLLFSRPAASKQAVPINLLQAEGEDAELQDFRGDDPACQTWSSDSPRPQNITSDLSSYVMIHPGSKGLTTQGRELFSPVLLGKNKECFSSATPSAKSQIPTTLPNEIPALFRTNEFLPLLLSSQSTELGTLSALQSRLIPDQGNVLIHCEKVTDLGTMNERQEA